MESRSLSLAAKVQIFGSLEYNWSNKLKTAKQAAAKFAKLCTSAHACTHKGSCGFYFFRSCFTTISRPILIRLVIRLYILEKPRKCNMVVLKCWS